MGKLDGRFCYHPPFPSFLFYFCFKISILFYFLCNI
uniref:Uncharacterized protein n=1 Tax=Rhizophora mucronata TaxID=61149 RepID=A0A2P2NEW8_RHIMU